MYSDQNDDVTWSKIKDNMIDDNANINGSKIKNYSILPNKIDMTTSQTHMIMYDSGSGMSANFLANNVMLTD